MTRQRTDWARLIRAFSGKRVAVYGDYMLDEMLRGEATRISPEAPVPVVLIGQPDTCEGYPGGAGNVAANVAALGGEAIPWGVVGKDEGARRLLDLLARRNIRCATLVRESRWLTPRKLRIAAHQHQLLRVDFERPSKISSEASSSITRSFSRWAGRLDALIISDYQKGSVTPEVCDSIFRPAHRFRVPIFIDPKPAYAELCRGVTVATPNRQEAEVMLGASMRDRRQLERGGLDLLKRLGCAHLLVTRSSEGMTLFTQSPAFLARCMT
jgi:rfaE bifunctional protein kinase chain/domain